MFRNKIFYKKTTVLEEKKGAIVSLLFASFIFMLSIAYGAMNSNLRITSEAHYRVQANIRITGIQLVGVTYNGLEDYKSDYSKNTIKTGISLSNSNSTVTYRVKITNSGNVAMVLKSLENTEVYNNSNIKYTLNKSLPLTVSPLTSEYIEITFSWNSYNPSNTRLDSIIKFNFTQAESILAGGNNGSTTFLNTSPINKTQVEKIQFMPTTEVPNAALGQWDASRDLDGSVKAWYIDEDGNNLYEVYIGGYGEIKLSTGQNLFRNFSQLVTLNFNNAITTEDVTNMNAMFRDDNKLTGLDFSKFDFSKVTNMAQMLFNCSSLTSLSLEQVTASQLTTMESFMSGCTGLTSINMDYFSAPNLQTFAWTRGEWVNSPYTTMNIVTASLKNWNISRLTNVSNMFYNWNKMTTLDIRNMNIQSATNMQNMFQNCSLLATFNISGIDTQSATNMQNLFYGCSKLTTLDLSDFVTTNVTNMQSMFYNCSLLTSLDISSFNTANVTNMYQMFRGVGLSSIDFSKLNLSSVTNASQMFYWCTSLTSIDFSNKTALSLTNMQSFMGGSTAITSINFDNFSAPNLTTFDWTKGEWVNSPYTTMNVLTASLKDLDISGLTDVSKMFYNWNKMTTLDISGINTQGATNMTQMFYGCNSLTSLNLSDLDTANVTNMSQMFYNCSALTSLDVSSFNTANVTNMSQMFYGCAYLSSLNLNSFSGDSVTDMSFMAFGLHRLTSFVMNDFEAPNLTTVNTMFGYTYNWGRIGDGASGVTIQMQNFRAKNLNDISNLFGGKAKITNVDLRGFYAPKITNFSGLFSGCSGLRTLNLSGVDFSNITNVSNFGSNTVTALTLDDIADTVYANNTYFRTAIDLITTSTATVYVEDSNCEVEVRGIKSTLNPVVIGA